MENNQPKTWFLESILVTFFCCLPMGIVSIIKANKVKNFTAAGQIDEANAASAEAKKWVMYTAISGFVIIAAYYAWFFLGGGQDQIMNAAANAAAQ